MKIKINTIGAAIIYMVGAAVIEYYGTIWACGLICKIVDKIIDSTTDIEEA